MTEERPLIEAAHVRIAGISEHAYELPGKGEERLYLVRTIRDGYSHNEFKTQPDRVDVKMKIVALAELPSDELDSILAVAGLPKETAALFRAAKDDPSLFDGGQPEDMDGPAFDGGPSFSAGE